MMIRSLLLGVLFALGLAFDLEAGSVHEKKPSPQWDLYQSPKGAADGYDTRYIYGASCEVYVRNDQKGVFLTATETTHESIMTQMILVEDGMGVARIHAVKDNYEALYRVSPRGGLFEKNCKDAALSLPVEVKALFLGLFGIGIPEKPKATDDRATYQADHIFRTDGDFLKRSRRFFIQFAMLMV